MKRAIVRTYIAAALGAVLLVYEPAAAVMRWNELPRWIYPGRMVPFLIGVTMLGALVSPRARSAWATAIAVARVVFHDTAVRAGVFGDRSPWLTIHELHPAYQAVVLLLALAIHVGTYWCLMMVGSWVYRRWVRSSLVADTRDARISRGTAA